MGRYEVYATKNELAQYLGKTLEELPVDSDRLLSRASELVGQVVLNNLDKNNPDDMEAVCLATCAQIEYWLEIGETPSTIGAINNFNMNGVSMSFRNGSDILSPRAKVYLNSQYLLYRGIRL